MLTGMNSHSDPLDALLRRVTKAKSLPYSSEMTRDAFQSGHQSQTGGKKCSPPHSVEPEETHTKKNVLKLFSTHVRTMECVPKRRMMAGGQALLYLRPPPHVSADPAGMYSNTENPIRLQVSSHTATHHVQGARRAEAETRDSATPHKPDESSYAGSEMKYPTPFENSNQTKAEFIHLVCISFVFIFIQW